MGQLEMTAMKGKDPRFAAVMLRVVLALKRDPEATVDSVLNRVITETGVNGAAFREFFALHMNVVTRSSRLQN